MNLILEDTLSALGAFLQENGIKVKVGIETLSFSHASLHMKNAEIKCHGGTIVTVCGRRMLDRESGNRDFDVCDPNSFQEILELVKSDKTQA
jgi:hypothetical protein